MTEMQIETRDFKFNKYLQDKTDSKIDIFKNYYQRVDKIIAKGKITTDNQFYDINILADHICQTAPVYKEKLEMLNILLNDFENRKSKEPKKPPA
ncbi:MAG: hypothetical protein IPK10_13130 [Bacteroidetes bacterium]|nr:hypothetical protein [Bacteroidota bacterium]